MLDLLASVARGFEFILHVLLTVLLVLLFYVASDVSALKLPLDMSAAMANLAKNTIAAIKYLRTFFTAFFVAHLARDFLDETVFAQACAVTITISAYRTGCILATSIFVTIVAWITSHVYMAFGPLARLLPNCCKQVPELSRQI
jgi:hypothetical protein